MSRRAINLGLTALLLLGAAEASAWSGGPIFNVTDIDAKCAVCHASTSRQQDRLEPAGVQNFQIVDNKHYKAIEDGTGPYATLPPADRQKLLADVKIVDQNAAVTVSAPESLRPGQEAQITVSVRGGHEVVGVALMDTDLRSQGRSIQGDGWTIVGMPKVWASDGQEQTRWTDRRGAGLRKNINSAVIFDQKADLGAKKFASGRAAWTVRAPQEPGSYTIAAVMFFGTEKASAVGVTTTAAGTQQPRGGAFGAGGRILFSKPVTVTVR